MSVMTSAFVDAARLMATVQGAPDHRFAVIDHPIASADPAGLAARASAFVDQAVAVLTESTESAAVLTESHSPS